MLSSKTDLVVRTRLTSANKSLKEIGTTHSSGETGGRGRLAVVLPCEDGFEDADAVARAENVPTESEWEFCDDEVRELSVRDEYGLFTTPVRGGGDANEFRSTDM